MTLDSALSDLVLCRSSIRDCVVSYTSDFQYNSRSCHLQKHSDDSAVVGCISEGQEEYRALVGEFDRMLMWWRSTSTWASMTTG